LRGHPQAAVAFWKLHPRQAGVELVAPELEIGLGFWVVLGEERVEGCLDLLKIRVTHIADMPLKRCGVCA